MSRPGSPDPLEALFETRAARAEALAPASAAASEPLRFAAGLYRAQARAAREFSSGPRALSGRLREDVGGLLPGLRPVVEFAAAGGPPALADEARRRSEEEPAVTEARLLAYWRGDSDARLDYLSRALLRPYAAVLRSLGLHPDRAIGPGRCPFCGGGPWIAARRAEGEGDGAQRRLGCSLCAGEWPFGRILCPCCGEGDPRKLPSFQADAHPLARIEACETCHRYVKSLDLTADARPIPEVDDLLSLAMDLWASREGFTRIEPGIAGV